MSGRCLRFYLFTIIIITIIIIFFFLNDPRGSHMFDNNRIIGSPDKYDFILIIARRLRCDVNEIRNKYVIPFAVANVVYLLCIFYLEI